MTAARETCIGFDVGKSAHRACAVSRATGEALFNEPLENREDAIDAVLARAGGGALAVVDQKRNVGALVLGRARAASAGSGRPHTADEDEVVARCWPGGSPKTPPGQRRPGRPGLPAPWRRRVPICLT